MASFVWSASIYSTRRTLRAWWAASVLSSKSTPHAPDPLPIQEISFCDADSRIVIEFHQKNGGVTMAQQSVLEGTPEQLARLLGTLSNLKRYRIIELEESIPSPAMKETSPVLDAENAAAVAQFRLWREQDATDDPEEIRKAEEELEDLRRNLNANRAATGERLISP